MDLRQIWDLQQGTPSDVYMIYEKSARAGPEVCAPSKRELQHIITLPIARLPDCVDVSSFICFEKIERGARVADCDNALLKAISTVEGLWALGSAGLPFLSESVLQTLKKGAITSEICRQHRRSFPPYQVSSNLEAK